MSSNLTLKKMSQGVSRKVDVPVEVTRSVLISFLTELMLQVAKGESVTFQHFGKFMGVEVKPKQYRFFGEDELRWSRRKVEVRFFPSPKFAKLVEGADNAYVGKGKVVKDG